MFKKWWMKDQARNSKLSQRVAFFGENIWKWGIYHAT